VINSHLMRHFFPGIHFRFPFEIGRDGGFGVNVFFVISGFLITKLLLEEEEFNGHISLKNFYIRRSLRIFPAYYFVLFVYLILQVCGVLYFTHTSWATSVFYLKYYGGSDWESGHFWSLSVEEHFYLFWPIIFKLYKNRRVFIAWVLIIGVMLCRLNAYLGVLPFTFLVQQESFFMRADALMIGCLIAIYYQKIQLFILQYKSVWYIIPVTILAIAFLNSGILTDLNYSKKLHLGLILIPLGVDTSGGLITNLLIGLLAVVSINFTATYWYKILNTSVFEYIGKLSYSIYLWQQLFFSDRMGVFARFPLNILMILLSALFSYHFIEKPFLRLKDKFRLPVPATRVAL
jgi:peptidoglycan/LPS O-acetylase OafA/YrhL